MSPPTMAPTAIVRGIPASFAAATVRQRPAEAIDVEAARREHAGYVRALRDLGVAVIELPADDDHPDSCFVEDCALVHEGVALVTRPGAASRRGEVEAVAVALAEHARVERMQEPATLDGGDCLRIGSRLYVGQGARTNAAGLARARAVFEPLGLEVVGVPDGALLHLKCACTYVGRGRVVLAEGTIPPSVFAGIDPIRIPSHEQEAANCLAVGDVVLAAAGFPATHRALEEAGFSVRPVANEQIRRADGALTCLSIRFGLP